MAKKSQVLRDRKRQKLITKYAEKRAELRKKLNDPEVSIEEKVEVQVAFSKLPRNSCPTRLNRRCEVSGRSKSYSNSPLVTPIRANAIVAASAAVIDEADTFTTSAITETASPADRALITM